MSESPRVIYLPYYDLNYRKGESILDRVTLAWEMKTAVVCSPLLIDGAPYLVQYRCCSSIVPSRRHKSMAWMARAWRLTPRSDWAGETVTFPSAVTGPDYLRGVVVIVDDQEWVCCEPVDLLPDPAIPDETPRLVVSQSKKRLPGMNTGRAKRAAQPAPVQPSLFGDIGEVL